MSQVHVSHYFSAVSLALSKFGATWTARDLLIVQPPSSAAFSRGAGVITSPHVTGVLVDRVTQVETNKVSCVAWCVKRGHS
jgi:hypothetical protein